MMSVTKLENMKVQVVAATEVRVRNEDKTIVNEATRGNGLLVLRVDKANLDDVTEWLKGLAREPSWRKLPIAVELRKWYRAKTHDQLALFWSLIKIMSLHQEGKHDEETKQGYYHGLLYMYGARTVAKLPDGRVEEALKTLSEMNTVEASQLIEGAFRELALMDCNVTESSKIKNFYIEWRTWRGQLKHDGMDETYKSLDDYRDRVPFCEATLVRLQPGEGHLAHIVSSGASGESNEPWNFLHLCAEVHIGLQHTKGWVEMLEKYPHLMGKVNVARKRHGLQAIKKPEDLYEDLATDDAPDLGVKTLTDEEISVVDAQQPDLAVEITGEEPRQEVAEEPAVCSGADSEEEPEEKPEKKAQHDGRRRLWLHSESDSYVVSRGDMHDGVVVEVAVVETDSTWMGTGSVFSEEETMDFNLEQLGITKDELADRVVDSIANRLLYREVANEDGNMVSGLESAFSHQLEERLLKAIGEAVNALAEKHVVPALVDRVEELDFQPQSRYGEPKGEPITYKEYLAGRADTWLTQTVDHDGNEKGDYHFRDQSKKTTRAAFLVNQYFSRTVEKALKEAVGAANEKIAEGLEKAVAMKIREIAAGLKVDIKPAK
jgi:hypothetical protein